MERPTKIKSGSKPLGAGVRARAHRELIEKITGLGTKTIKNQFFYNKKKLSNIGDVQEYLENFFSKKNSSN